MATQGPNLPGAGKDVNDGSAIPWVNPGNITAEDGIFATVALVGAASDWLVGTTMGWTGLTGATISNVKGEAKYKLTTGSAFNMVMGSMDGTNTVLGQGASQNATTTLVWVTMFDRAPWTGTQAAILAGTDEWCFKDLAPNGPYTVDVDAMRVTLTYTIAGGMPNTQRRTVAIHRAANY